MKDVKVTPLISAELRVSPSTAAKVSRMVARPRSQDPREIAINFIFLLRCRSSVCIHFPFSISHFPIRPLMTFDSPASAAKTAPNENSRVIKYKMVNGNWKMENEYRPGSGLCWSTRIPDQQWSYFVLPMPRWMMCCISSALGIPRIVAGLKPNGPPSVFAANRMLSPCA